jgi:hypothetical protein
MKKIFFLIINLALLTLIAVAAFYLITQRTKIFAESNNYNLNKTLDVTIEEKVKEPPRTKPPEIEVKAIYLTSNSAANSKTIDKFIDFIKNTELNAVVIDIKDYSGKLSYDSQIDLVNQLENDHNLIKDLPDLIQKLHDNNIYVIARQTVFQDPELSAKKTNWAVKNKSTGGLWYDYKGLTWTDPTQQAVWDYNLQIAKEAIDLGFDEINFDYIRFPSDGPMKQMAFNNMNSRTKAEVMADFYKFLHENLKDEPAYISGDLFGLTTERNDDMNIGQQLEDAALYFDYVCPMIYPSHYPSGHLNLANPAAHPYEVISQAMKKGAESIQPLTEEIIETEETETGEIIEHKKVKVTEYRAKLRPWLQAFNMGAVYTPSMIDEQIQASAENGGFGYLLWNARNVYNYAPVN